MSARRTPPDLIRPPRVGAAVYEDMPFEDATARLSEVLAGGYSVSLFTTWQRRASDGRLHFEQVRKAARAGRCLAASPTASALDCRCGASA